MFSFPVLEPFKSELANTKNCPVNRSIITLSAVIVYRREFFLTLKSRLKQRTKTMTYMGTSETQDQRTLSLLERNASSHTEATDSPALSHSIFPSNLQISRYALISLRPGTCSSYFLSAKCLPHNRHLINSLCDDGVSMSNLGQRSPCTRDAGSMDNGQRALDLELLLEQVLPSA